MSTTFEEPEKDIQKMVGELVQRIIDDITLPERTKVVIGKKSVWYMDFLRHSHINDFLMSAVTRITHAMFKLSYFTNIEFVCDCENTISADQSDTIKTECCNDHNDKNNFCLKSTLQRLYEDIINIRNVHSDTINQYLQLSQINAIKFIISRFCKFDNSAFICKDKLLLSRYRYEKKILDGSFGHVVLVTDTHTENHVVIKLSKSGTKGLSLHSNEYELLKLFNPDNNTQLPFPVVYDYGIMNAYDSLTVNKIAYIVMEYYGPDLFDSILHQKITVNVQWIRKTFTELCQALKIIHEHNIIHKDIKPENILLKTSDIHGGVVLIDFGLSVKKGEQKHIFTGTAEYMTPEEYFELPLCEKSDVWKLGWVMFELYTKKHAFLSSLSEKTADFSILYGLSYTKFIEKYDAYNNISQRSLDGIVSTPILTPTIKTYAIKYDCKSRTEMFDKHIHDQLLCDLLTKCTNIDPDERLTAEEVLSHPFITNRE